MKPNIKFFDWIEDYCLEQLSEIEKQQFETELKQNSELIEEVNLFKEIQSAIAEKDITNLEEELSLIAESVRIKEKNNGSFELLDDFVDIQEITETVSPEDLINYYDSLPRVHVYNHELSSNENIHQFYKEQNKAHDGEDLGMNGFDFEDLDDFQDLEGLEEAIMEKDILNLRETLSQAAKSVKPQFSTKEIDKYLSGELKGFDLKKFEAELEQNRVLNKEVELHREMERSIGEKDIFTFREKLNSARKSSGNAEKKSILPEKSISFYGNWKRVVAVAILLLGIAGIYNIGFNSIDKSLDSFYTTPESSVERGVLAASLNNDVMNLEEQKYFSKANSFYTGGEFEKALPLFRLSLDSKTKENNFVSHFYIAACLHKLDRFEEAIPEYNQVIHQGDNYFIEEAEWYKSLCYLELGDKKMAKQNLEAIVDKNGYYKKAAKLVLRHLKFSIR